MLDTIFNENCLETMARMPDNFIDLTITSPPYNMNLRVRNNKYTSRQIVKEFSTKYQGFDDNLPIEEYYQLHKKILSELIRTSRMTFYNFQVVTGSKEAMFRLIGDYSTYIKDVIVWDKGSSQPSMNSGVMNASHELILVLENTNTKGRQLRRSYFERGTLSNLWKVSSRGAAKSNHGAVFPLELARKIITNFSKEGDVIYDPFMGTGTTARAAMDLNRRYIGSELSSSYCAIIEQRLSQQVLL